MTCSQCGICCTLFLINLNEEEYQSQKYETVFSKFIPDFEEAQSYGANILKQKADGSCFYLINNRCSIHDSRPKSCREFFCDSQESRFQEMIAEIKKAKEKKH